MIFCIDSHIVIWGFKRQEDPGNEGMIARTDHFLQWVDNGKHHLQIPSIVIAEILSPEPPEKYADILAKFTKNCIVTNLDLRTATMYAKICGTKYEDLKDAAKAAAIRKEKMKLDHLIIANALVNNATCIYSHDEGLKKWAKGLIDVKDLPPLPPPTLKQTTLTFTEDPDLPF